MAVAEIAVECHVDGDVVVRGSVVNLHQRAEAVAPPKHGPGVRAVDDQLRSPNSANVIAAAVADTFGGT